MPIREEEIRKYARLMGELGLTALEIKENENFVRLERGVSVSAPTQAPVVAASPVQQGDASAAASAADAGTVTVTSPMVGVFYRAPAEDAEPYVKVGDEVKQGQVLCLIEAMKMMNEITAECDGVLVEVCAKNAQVVDFGYPLFRIKR